MMTNFSPSHFSESSWGFIMRQGSAAGSCLRWDDTVAGSTSHDGIGEVSFLVSSKVEGGFSVHLARALW